MTCRHESISFPLLGNDSGFNVSNAEHLSRPGADHDLPKDSEVRYARAFVDLNGDKKKEAIVYLVGQWWCGSGGCPTLILKRTGSSFGIVTSISITRPPIKVLSTRSNGWRDISVWVQGGGIQPGYAAKLQFDGKTYPSNPSTPPARRLENHVGGIEVIQSIDGAQPLHH